MGHRYYTLVTNDKVTPLSMCWEPLEQLLSLPTYHWLTLTWLLLVVMLDGSSPKYTPALAIIIGWTLNNVVHTRKDPPAPAPPPNNRRK